MACPLARRGCPGRAAEGGQVSDDRLEGGLRAAFGPAPEPEDSVLARLDPEGRLSSRVVLLRDDGEAAAPLTTGGARTEGRYQILGEIARGGMGVILKGHDTDLGRDVAVKVLRDEHAAGRPASCSASSRRRRSAASCSTRASCRSTSSACMADERPVLHDEAGQGAHARGAPRASAQTPGARPPPLPRDLRVGLPDDGLRARAAA